MSGARGARGAAEHGALRSIDGRGARLVGCGSSPVKSDRHEPCRQGAEPSRGHNPAEPGVRGTRGGELRPPCALFPGRAWRSGSRCRVGGCRRRPCSDVGGPCPSGPWMPSRQMPSVKLCLGRAGRGRAGLYRPQRRIPRTCGSGLQAHVHGVRLIRAGRPVQVSLYGVYNSLGPLNSPGTLLDRTHRELSWIELSGNSLG